MTKLRRVLGLACAALVLGAGTLFGQASTATVRGQVTGTDGSGLAGAQIVVTNALNGSQTGAIAGQDGRFTVPGLRAGATYRVEAQLIGFGTQVVEDVRLASGETREINFVMRSQAVAVDAIEVLAERAVERKTPAAFTTVEKAQVQQQLASRDIPMVLNTAPSVYATQQGGGAGDARVNVRGFNQRNIAIMINGVPVNDMENGWVYWSNWDGVGDATSSIQLQRGLSNVNLATPSIGGTMNVITDAAGMSRGMSLKQEFGSDGFLKTTVSGSTGLINNRFALTASAVRKLGDGYSDGAWTDAWAYYLASSYIINDNNRLEFYALGAPQRHGQNLYKQNIAAYSHELAEELGYSAEALAAIPEAGRRYNQNYNTVSESYSGQQTVGGKTFDRFDKGFLNERENFYHKPQVNLNYYSQLTPSLLWSTVAYYSGGNGGGTGTAGSMVWDNDSKPTRIVNWDATIARNKDTSDGSPMSRGILRNSRNNQWTIGAISKMKWQATDALSTQVGVDWRTAEIEHYYEVRDLLGGEYYEDDNNEFWTVEEQKRRPGDKFNYYNTNQVDWVGGYAQAEYSVDRWTGYAMAGVSTIKYAFTDHFKKDEATGGELQLNPDGMTGYQVKGGGLYNVNEQLSLFANAGYVSKVPIFDGVIDDYNSVINPDPKNEKFVSLEAGTNFRLADGKVAGKLNFYNTTWKDRTVTRFVTQEDGEGGLVNLLGMNSLHQGLEVELAYQPSDLIRFDGAASFGNWKYTDDVMGIYTSDARVGEQDTLNAYIKELKVGDAPQTQLSYAVSLYPTTGAYIQLLGRTFDSHYAEFNPVDRDEADDRAQSWQAPGYTVFDLFSSYTFRSPRLPMSVQVFANVTNVFDKLYVQDAVDNSSFSGYKANGTNHSADDAEVYLGTPRTFNIGTKVSF